MFNATKPLPEPYKEVRRLWQEFLANVAAVARVEVESFSVGTYIDGGRMEVVAQFRRYPPDTPVYVE